jgi:hypothetical protein
MGHHPIRERVAELIATIERATDAATRQAQRRALADAM